MNQPDQRSPALPLHGGAWDASRAFWTINRRKGTSLEERVALLEQELELRDFYARYFDALDSRDLEAIMDFFHDEAVHAGNEGTFTGKTAIRQYYQDSIPKVQHRAHNTGNVAVRLLSPHDAWISSRNFTSSCTECLQNSCAQGTVQGTRLKQRRMQS